MQAYRQAIRRAEAPRTAAIALLGRAAGQKGSDRALACAMSGNLLVRRKPRLHSNLLPRKRQATVETPSVDAGAGVAAVDAEGRVSAGALALQSDATPQA